MILRPSYLHNGISYTGKEDIFKMNQGPGSNLVLPLATVITLYYTVTR